MPRVHPLPVVCDASAFSSTDSFTAHIAEGRRLLSMALERLELTDGWALRLPNDDGTLLSLAQWIAGERRCCPFFTFSLKCEPLPGGLWVQITGPAGAKDVLQAELSSYDGRL
jgi:hypothetical protein